MSADATQVTGSPLAGPGIPRPGAVLAERYELLEVIDSDGPAVSFRALDQESERQVLVRILAGPGVHTDVCDEMVAHLRDLVGVGGRFLSSLLDADREGRSPFTVEAWPKGTPLSAILDSRRGRGEALGAREALPVVAQLAAALAALPEGLHHGDVRAERVWLDTDGLRLTGAFLLTGLPQDELRERVQGLGPGAVAYAPEVKEGMTGPASDLWGVGSIAWEALTGRSPDPTAPSPEVDGELKEALAALLADAPDERPPDLQTVLEAVAREADLPVPDLDPEPHQPPTALIMSPLETQGTEPSAGATEPPSDDSLDPRLVRAALGVSMANDTAKHASVSDELADSLDPRLVRAALDVALEPSSDGVAVSGEPSSDGLDPRLVRAALGVELDSTESIEMELVEEPQIPKPRGAPKPKPPRPFLEKPHAKSGFPRPGGRLAAKKPLASLPRPKPRSRADAPPGPKPRPRADAPPGPKPRADAPPGPKPRPRADAPPGPKPRARADSADRPTPKPRPAAEMPPAPKPQPRPSPPSPTSRADAPPAPIPHAAPPRPRADSASQPAPRPRTESGDRPTPTAAAPRASAPARTDYPTAAAPPGAPMDEFDIPMEDGTIVVAPRVRRAPPVKRNRTGVVIVVIALLLAVAIVGVGFLIAAQRRADAARERQIDERIEELMQDQGADAPR